MRCPVCQNEVESPQDNTDVLFEGMCSECLLYLDYYYAKTKRTRSEERDSFEGEEEFN